MTNIQPAQPADNWDDFRQINRLPEQSEYIPRTRAEGEEVVKGSELQRQRQEDARRQDRREQVRSRSSSFVEAAGADVNALRDKSGKKPSRSRSPGKDLDERDAELQTLRSRVAQLERREISEDERNEEL